VRSGVPRGRRLRTTTPGKWFLALTLGAGIAAVNTGNNLLYAALAMNLALILLSGVLSEWSLRGIAVRILPGPELFAGRDGLLRVACRAGRRFLPSFGVRILVGTQAGEARAAFGAVPAGGAAERLAPFRPARRGVFVPAFCLASTRFPFSLFEKTLAVPAAGEIVVSPLPLPPPGEPAAADGGGARERPAAAGQHGPFVRGARDLLPGDPAREVHWKTSARLGKWMAKDREPETTAAADVRVDLSLPEAALEGALRAACGLVLRYEAQGRPYRLWLGETLCAAAEDPDRRAKALRALALAPGGPAPGAGGRGP